MSSASIEFLPDDHLNLHGQLDFNTVTELLPKLKAHIVNAKAKDITISFSHVKKANSAGLALASHITRLGSECNKRVIVRSLPQDLLDIAKVSQMDAWFQ